MWEYDELVRAVKTSIKEYYQEQLASGGPSTFDKAVRQVFASVISGEEQHNENDRNREHLPK